jgi:methylthioribose-1-phosphate isomerase
MEIRPMVWREGALVMLDQRLLPGQEVWLTLTGWEEVRDAIRDMAVRGAPAIGVVAAYGMALAAQQGADLAEAHRGLAASRPTAVNLFWALDRMAAVADPTFARLLAEAQAIEAEDLAMNHRIGGLGADLVPGNARILTICNTGSLATAGHGTALGIIRTAHAQGKVSHVYSCETRPRQQGLRLTAWELLKDGIPFQSIPDSAAASLMRAGKVDFVVAGADRITRNGDTANKIGTYMLAVCAHHHGIPFVIAAPTSTIDPAMATGAEIPIEERDASEITEIEGVRVAPAGCPTFNPGFDVTPGELIHAIVTERGVFRAPYDFSLPIG